MHLGWVVGGKTFSDLVHNSTSRETFVTTTCDFLKKYNFDGLDLDWEYPGSDSGRETDKWLLTLFLRVILGNL